MKRFQLWCAAMLLPLLAACNVNVIPPTDFTETRTFDLASPAPVGELPFVVEVETFSNECSGRYKMIVREDANRIAVDEYNRWSMPPGAMLTKYLAARFAAQPQAGDSRDQGKQVFILDGSVLNCELDKAKKQVCLLVHFFIVEPGSNTFRLTGTENCVVPVKDITAEAFADGMNKAAAEFADRVVSVLKEELKKRADEANAASETK
ncbi:MAG: membrane integrity-associated transporter subunit PqiC [Lentisphaeria bacterium]|nr:membrane integrity-associated transporter subunit PqiC [Lentisphaeria bacterium]